MNDYFRLSVIDHQVRGTWKKRFLGHPGESWYTTNRDRTLALVTKNQIKNKEKQWTNRGRQKSRINLMFQGFDRFCYVVLNQFLVCFAVIFQVVVMFGYVFVMFWCVFARFCYVLLCVAMCLLCFAVCLLGFAMFCYVFAMFCCVSARFCYALQCFCYVLLCFC